MVDNPVRRANRDRDGEMTTPLTHPEAEDQLRQVRQLADQIHGRLVEAGRTVAVAESLTGGLVSAFLTAAPGTSVTFCGGLVPYGSDAKQDIAGVNRASLDEYGSVHETIAEQLAAGARHRLRSDYGIGLTGVAGPGTQDGQPVGEVYVAIADADSVHAQRYQLEGNRDAVRLGSVVAALAQLLDTLDAQRQIRYDSHTGGDK